MAIVVLLVPPTNDDLEKQTWAEKFKRAEISMSVYERKQRILESPEMSPFGLIYRKRNENVGCDRRPVELATSRKWCEWTILLSSFSELC
jgi:hypothetical protein